MISLRITPEDEEEENELRWGSKQRTIQRQLLFMASRLIISSNRFCFPASSIVFHAPVWIERDLQRNQLKRLINQEMTLEIIKMHSSSLPVYITSIAVK